MIHNNSNHRTLKERLEDLNSMDRVVRDAVRDALRRHMLLGESVAVADESTEGAVKILGPEEIRKLLEAA